MKPKRKAGTESTKRDTGPPGEKKKLCKPPSLSCFTFDEVVDIALNTKPKKKGEEGKSGDDRIGERVEE
jgi:hypothetical protein